MKIHIGYIIIGVLLYYAYNRFKKKLIAKQKAIIPDPVIEKVQQKITEKRQSAFLYI